MNTVTTVLTFGLVILVGLLLLRPFAEQYVHTYEVRRRPRKKEADVPGAEVPRESALLALCKNLGTFCLNSLPQLADKTTLNFLKLANYRTREHLAIYIGIKALCVLIMLGMFLFMGISSGNATTILFAVVAAAMGWMVPNFFLAGRVKTRQKLLVGELPTIIDLLIVCAQAGLGLLMCIDKVAKETELTCPVLSSELTQFIQDVKIFAKPAHQALMDMADRCGSDEVSSVVSALVAAEAKGSDISYPLQQQAEALRDKLKRKKEEEAAKVPVKMVPVIVFFILPLVLCPILGPAVVLMANSFGGK